MRISKKVREEAARICSVCANNGEPVSVTRAVATVYGVDERLAVNSPVARVAVRAWAEAAGGFRRGYDCDALRDQYAEAEAMLRTGWTP